MAFKMKHSSPLNLINEGPGDKTKKLSKKQGTKASKDVNVTYYGTEKELKNNTAPSATQSSPGAGIFATSAGVRVPSSQSFSDARETEAAINRFDEQMKANAKRSGRSVREEDRVRREYRTYNIRTGRS
jgi:hypothetical protein